MDMSSEPGLNEMTLHDEFLGLTVVVSHIDGASQVGTRVAFEA